MMPKHSALAQLRGDITDFFHKASMVCKIASTPASLAFSEGISYPACFLV
jgi:hypothetical protein